MSDKPPGPSRLEKDLQKLNLSFRQKASKKNFESKKAEQVAEMMKEALDLIAAQKKEITELRDKVERLEKQATPEAGAKPQP